MNAHRITTSKLGIAFCALALAAQACAVDTDLPEDFEGAEDRDDELTKQTFGESASTVTFFGEAGLWGDSLTVQISPSGPEETVRLIGESEFAAEGLLNRVSSVRLQCGSRASSVVFFATHNTAPNLYDWHDYNDDGRRMSCDPGGTVELSLHTNGGRWADNVASAYFLADARESIEIEQFSTLIQNGWDEALDNLPSGADADTGAELRITGSRSFRLHQELRLDDWKCGGRDAQFELRGQMASDGDWDVIVISTYVDTGWGDYWGCRSKMQNALKDAAQDATYELETGLLDLMLLAGDHPRYYLVPGWGLDEFGLHAGGEPLEMKVLQKH